MKPHEGHENDFTPHAETVKPAHPTRLPAIIAIIGLLLLFLLLNWNSINAPFETDEGEYAYSAWLMKEGVTPYQHSFMQKPPMIIYTYFIAQLLGGNAVWPAHVLGALFLALSTALIGLIAAREFGKSTGWLSMWLFLPMMALPILAPFAANTEKFLILPMLGMTALYAFNRNGTSKGPWFWSGVLCAVSMYYKPVIPFFSAFLYIAWAIDVRRENRKIVTIVKMLAWAGLGMAVVSAGVFSYFANKGALPQLWESTVTYNLQMLDLFGNNTGAFLYHLGELFKAWYFPLFLLLWILVKPVPRQWFYVGLLLVNLFSVRNAHAGHYFIIALPMLAILSAQGLQACGEKVSEWTACSKGAVIIAVAVISVALECWPLRHQVSMTPDQLASTVYDGYAFVESPIVAKRVAELTNSNDSVFVAGSEPQILFYAQRKSPSRFVTMFPLMFPTPSAAAYQQETIRDLFADPPKVIVFARYQWSWWQTPQSPTLILNYLSKLFEERYRLVGGFVRNGNGGEWQEPMDARALSKCLLTVYERKDDQQSRSR